MVDKTVVASKIASVRDAASRIRSTLPSTLEAFLADRTAREVTVLNLFVALQAFRRGRLRCVQVAAVDDQVRPRGERPS